MTARSRSRRNVRESRSKLHRRRAVFCGALENLEQRRLLAASWQTLAASGSGPANRQSMMLLSDGLVLVQGGANQSTATMYRLAPQANTGSYVNGNWTTAGSMS